ncbi:MAG: FAD-dependent oxidoreductase [Proteobacteria bacterium]|nr:FAD-dependent oxidoreductase [Pseudomonadota bacterium]
MRSFDSRLVRAEELTPTVRRLWFERADGQALAFSPGQYARFALHATEGLAVSTGAYSLCEPPRADGRYAICVKQQRAHGVAEALLHAEPGLCLPTQAPVGRFVLEPRAAAPLLLVATGVGVAPFHAMIEQLRELVGHCEVHLLLGARRPAELLFDDEWRALASSAARFHYRPVVSRPEPEDDWKGRIGRVDALLDGLPQLLSGFRAYVCGHSPMVLQLRAELFGRGLAVAQLHTDH